MVCIYLYLGTKIDMLLLCYYIALFFVSDNLSSLIPFPTWFPKHAPYLAPFFSSPDHGDCTRKHRNQRPQAVNLHHTSGTHGRRRLSSHPRSLHRPRHARRARSHRRHRHRRATHSRRAHHSSSSRRPRPSSHTSSSINGALNRISRARRRHPRAIRRRLRTRKTSRHARHTSLQRASLDLGDGAQVLGQSW